MSDPKNKWNQPAAPPPPMFFGKKERDLVKQVNDELAERVIGQPIAYYPISLEESNFNKTYGESQEKVSLPPVRVYAYVVVENEQTNETFGYEYQTKLTVNFHRRRLVEDQDLFVRVGDFIQYGDQYYEIVRTYNDTRYLFGQVEHKFQIAAECVRARHGVFRVMPSIDRAGVEAEQQDEPSSAPAPRPVPFPPVAATYITVKPESKLPNERVLTAGTGIAIVDGGPNGPITVNSTAATAAGPTGSVQLQAGDGIFVGTAALSFLTGSNALTVLGEITSSTNVSASFYHGDGRYLTGITASAAEIADGPVGSLQFRYDIPIPRELSGSANVLYDYTNRHLTVDAGLVHARTSIASSHTASVSEYILAVTAVPTSIELDATAFASGQVLLIKDESGLASAVDTITLAPSGPQTVDGAPAVSIESPYGSVLVYSNGSNWFIY